MNASQPRPGSYEGLPAGLHDVYQRIYRAAEPWLEIRQNAIHTRVSCQFAVEILRREGGDPQIVVPAILLHDVGWSAVGEERLRGAYGPDAENGDLVRLHEVKGAELAQQLLAAQGYPADATVEIIRIIERHDSCDSSETLEEAIVKDSDKCYRATKAAFLYFPEAVGTSLQGWHDWLVEGYQRWMLTASGRELAWECLAATREELGLLGPASV